MNLLYSKLWNRLSTESTNKLVFIYMNTRALRKAVGEDWSDEDILALEEEIFQRQQDDDDETRAIGLLGKRMRIDTALLDE